MMKKLTALLMAIVMTIAMAVTTAFATAKQIPDLANCFPDDITFIQEDAANGIRVYAADDAEVLMNDVAEYLGILCADYGFGGIETDFESSDSFVYVYLTEYSGDATPEYIDSCPEEAYVLVGMTGTGDQYIAMVVAVEGIEISDSEMPDASADMESYDYAALPDPGLFFECERGQDFYDETHKSYCVNYHFGMDDGGAEAVDEYLNLLLNGPYDLELVDVIESDYIDTAGHLFYDYIFEYTGPHYSGNYVNYEGEWEGDIHILIGLYFDRGSIGFSVHYGDGFTLVDNGLRTSYELVDWNAADKPDYDDDSDNNWDYDTEDECIICDGTGWRDCLTCNGSGYTGYGSDRHECPSFNCNGGNVSCTTCGGDGRK